VIEEPKNTISAPVSASTPPDKKVLRILIILIPVILIGGVVIAFLAGYGYLEVDPGIVIAMIIISSSIILCCASIIYTQRVTQKMASYYELENEYKEGMIFFENEEWELAIKIFTKIMGENMDHKRALYYTSRCYEKLDDWQNVKKYCKRYLELQPKDKEVWELLSTAHKRLFEYEESEEALKQASYL
jgi:tetratricopeptide (TPR) repeat protein